MIGNYRFSSGNSPLLISMPHAGTAIPKEIACNMSSAALQMPDVDWHLPHLYDMAKSFDATVLSAEYMRYVIDLNRPPNDISLYPGQDTTGLCPIDTFSKLPIYLKNKQPDEAEIKARVELYWRPYHDKLAEELKRIYDIHGIVILLDAHSIASRVPRFFDGKLPDLNFGTADQQSCGTSLQAALESLMQNYEDKSTLTPAQTKPYSHVFNGRFKGGYITRQYGNPAINIHAIQLEISQCTYMQEKAPYTYDPTLANELKPLISSVIQTCVVWSNFKAHKI
ncbi:N-formylglutamate amidohydrolase [mine drainage metagenome]|uniref:N-formylglutamate amidohydrolase n=1 Tax=mine drainage metagenome TaxID=410659 RepID=A0A1J5S8X8_9ZZZZ